jgi:hypothetical protein
MYLQQETVYDSVTAEKDDCAQQLFRPHNRDFRVHRMNCDEFVVQAGDNPIPSSLFQIITGGIVEIDS